MYSEECSQTYEKLCTTITVTKVREKKVNITRPKKDLLMRASHRSDGHLTTDMGSEGRCLLYRCSTFTHASINRMLFFDNEMIDKLTLHKEFEYATETSVILVCF